MGEVLESQDVVSVVQDVFTSLLGLEIVSDEDDAPVVEPSKKVSTTVGIAGDWNGTLTMECDSDTACLLSSAMLGTDLDTDLTDDVKDVLGELVNIMAGNVKGTLPGQSKLSLPLIVEGNDYHVGILNGKVLMKKRLSCQGKTVTIAVVVREA